MTLPVKEAMRRDLGLPPQPTGFDWSPAAPVTMSHSPAPGLTAAEQNIKTACEAIEANQARRQRLAAIPDAMRNDLGLPSR